MVVPSIPIQTTVTEGMVKKSVLAGVMFLIASLTNPFPAGCTWADTIAVRVDVEGYDGNGFWLGLFSAPLTRGSSPRDWRLVETVETTLELKDGDELVLVALQKGSVPVIHQINGEARGRDVELQFRRGRSMRAEVVSSDGYPIAHASIEVSHVGGLLEEQLFKPSIYTWVSDDEGRVTISGLEPGTYEFEVVARIGFPASIRRMQFESEESDDSVERLSIPIAHFISGSVVDESDEPVANVEVIGYDVLYSREPQRQSISTLSDEEGSFWIGPFLKGESVYLEAKSLDNRFSATREAYAGHTRLKMKLRDPLNLTGTIVDAATGAPVENFTVTAMSGFANTMWTRERTVQGADGSLNLKNLDWRITHIVVEAMGYEFRLIRVRFESGGVVDMGTIELEVGRTLAGVVVDSSTGEPIEGAEIRHVGPDQPVDHYDTYLYRKRKASTSDSLGRFTLEALPRDDASILVTARNYGLLFSTLTNGQDNVQFELDRTEAMSNVDVEKLQFATIRGRVEDLRGQPLQEDVMVQDIGLNNAPYLGLLVERTVLSSYSQLMVHSKCGQKPLTTGPRLLGN